MKMEWIKSLKLISKLTKTVKNKNQYQIFKSIYRLILCDQFYNFVSFVQGKNYTKLWNKSQRFNYVNSLVDSHKFWTLLSVMSTFQFPESEI